MKLPKPRQFRLKKPSAFPGPSRLIHPVSRQVSVVRLGENQSPLNDLYHLLLTLPWSGFLGLIFLGYGVSNAFFALLYLLGGDCIKNARPGSFIDAFFFSIQTMATIGYGAMYPATLYANILMAVQALVGLLGVAVATGLMFARFSRPTARVMFSRFAVVHPRDGIPTLMFRAANQRYNQILEAQMRLTLVRDEVTAEGEFFRRFYDLPLVRSQTPVFALSWSVMHRLEPGSPLYGCTPEILAAAQVELVIILTGLDESFSQTVHARHSYIASEILWNMRFADILSKDEDGIRYVNYAHFHEVEPVAV